jgi:hypothetical protein
VEKLLIVSDPGEYAGRFTHHQWAYLYSQSHGLGDENLLGAI